MDMNYVGVFVQTIIVAYNSIIMNRIIMLLAVLCMIRERHVILKAALHTRLAV